MSTQCFKCRAQLNDGAKFCSVCGEPVQIPPKKTFCINCGAELNEGAQFCVRCGTRVGAALAAHMQPVQANVCSKCGEPVRADSKFCLKCGTPVGQGAQQIRQVQQNVQPVLQPPVQKNLCAKCGAEVREHSKFCLNCGAPVEIQGAESARNGAQNGDFRQQQASPIQDVQCTVNTIRDAAGKLQHIFEKNVTAADFAGEMRIPIGNIGDGQMMSFIRRIIK